MTEPFDAQYLQYLGLYKRRHYIIDPPLPQLSSGARLNFPF